MNIYKIAHFYSDDHDKTSFFVKSDIGARDLGEIIACIQFKLEELIHECFTIHDEHLLTILVDFFGVEDVTNEFQKYLPYTQLEDNQWDIVNFFEVPDSDFRYITQIDQFRVRESCCGPRYEELMGRHLPKTADFEKAVKYSKYHYEF